MKYFALEYTSPVFSRFINLGDDIQTLAMSRLLPKVDGYICREALSKSSAEGIVALNGFFMNTNHWPPAPTLRPLFFAFHISPPAQATICSPESINYLKRWQPIGCRDRGTQALLKNKGIDTFYSRCVTLTLDQRETSPPQGKIFIVGVTKKMQQAIPRAIRKKAIICDQAKLRLPITDTQTKLAMAEQLLTTYREQANLIITSKIHCALPCIAMGIPVVFLYDQDKRDDYRVKLVEDFIAIHYVANCGPLSRLNNYWHGKHINWEPEPPDISATKNEIKAAFYQQLQRIDLRKENLNGEQ